MSAARGVGVIVRISALCAFALATALFAGCAGTASSLVSTASANAEASSAQGATATTVVDAAYVIALEDGAYLVDTRTVEEYTEGHIPGALNASYPKSTGGPCQAEENAASFRAAWAKLEVPLDAHVVLYCRTGVRASAAATALKEDGYANVEVYEGSWTDWTADPSRPVES